MGQTFHIVVMWSFDNSAFKRKCRTTLPEEPNAASLYQGTKYAVDQNQDQHQWLRGSESNFGTRISCNLAAMLQWALFLHWRWRPDAVNPEQITAGARGAEWGVTQRSSGHSRKADWFPTLSDVGEVTSYQLLIFVHRRADRLGSEDVGAHVPAALLLGLPVTALVDMQGLSRYRVVQLLKPLGLVVVLMGA